MKQAKRSLAHILRELFFTLRVFLERAGERHHGSARDVEDGGDEGLEAGLAREGGRAAGMSNARGVVAHFFEETEGESVLDETRDDVLG